eukprot:2966314-Rhodomonas_salina.1
MIVTLAGHADAIVVTCRAPAQPRLFGGLYGPHLYGLKPNLVHSECDNVQRAASNTRSTELHVADCEQTLPHPAPSPLLSDSQDRDSATSPPSAAHRAEPRA